MICTILIVSYDKFHYDKFHYHQELLKSKAICPNIRAAKIILIIINKLNNKKREESRRHDPVNLVNHGLHQIM